MLRRIKVFIIFLVLGYILLVIRLYYWQIYKGKELAIQARGQQQASQILNATRGNILASDGSFLAASTDAWLLYANIPEVIDKYNLLAERLSKELADDIDDKISVEKEAEKIENLLNKRNSIWVPIKQKLSTQKKENIERLNIEGIGFEKQEGRYYPEASVSAHLLGFVGKDKEGNDQGYFGLEGFYNQVLTGKPGFVIREKDASGHTIVGGSSKEVSVIRGLDLLTHLNKGLSLKVDRKLKEGINVYGARGGTVIIMDPKNGGIVAMSSFPSYDPQKYFAYNDSLFLNPAISVSFEPGSIFKVLVMASALDSGEIKPDTKCDICNGPVKIDKYTIQTWNREYHPNSEMTDVIVNSDNVGMVYVGRKLGIDKMYNYLRAFGIGEVTGIDLQGEMSPKLRKKESWGQIDLATASFGQGIAVTPIQMVRAVGAIANKGIIVTPRVVEKIKGDDWEEEIKSEKGKRIISEKAAEDITTMMAEAAQRGESKWTNIKGFRVAGKTGTAQIPIAGHYDEDKTIASFIGFAPYENPKFVMLVTLIEPTTSPWASETAAPLWYSIAKDLFIYYGIQPSN